jgi:hypothetical protein
MKKALKQVLAAFALLAMIAVTASGCYEHRYYHEHNYHTGGWYHRHNTPPPAGVELDIHNR